MGKFILNWFSERLDLAPVFKLVGENLRKPVPTHVNWLFTLGASIACLLGLQIFSGLLLMIHYKPSAREAYTSIEFIMDQVTLGWFVRGLHSWGAHLIMILLLLHMVRVFVYGGYKRPREVTWVIGVLLFAVVAGFGFTGYLLPWDQMAYWATVVATEAPATIPLAGPLIKEFMVGGVEVADGTIGRFYVLHVIVLPLALFGLVGLHLFLIRYQGVSSLRRIDEPELTSPELGAAGGKPFWPYHVLKDLTSCYIIIAVLVTLALLFPPHLGDPANPFLTPIGIKPEWYFLPAYQLLKYVPEAVGRAGAAIVSVSASSAPVCHRSLSRAAPATAFPGDHRWPAGVLGWSFCLAFSVISLKPNARFSARLIGLISSVSRSRRKWTHRRSSRDSRCPLHSSPRRRRRH